MSPAVRVMVKAAHPLCIPVVPSSRSGSLAAAWRLARVLPSIMRSLYRPPMDLMRMRMFTRSRVGISGHETNISSPAKCGRGCAGTRGANTRGMPQSNKLNLTLVWNVNLGFHIEAINNYSIQPRLSTLTLTKRPISNPSRIHVKDVRNNFLSYKLHQMLC